MPAYAEASGSPDIRDEGLANDKGTQDTTPRLSTVGQRPQQDTPKAHYVDDVTI
jgi:hypothetical protein